MGKGMVTGGEGKSMFYRGVGGGGADRRTDRRQRWAEYD